MSGSNWLYPPVYTGSISGLVPRKGTSNSGSPLTGSGAWNPIVFGSTGESITFVGASSLTDDGTGKLTLNTPTGKNLFLTVNGTYPYVEINAGNNAVGISGSGNGVQLQNNGVTVLSANGSNRILIGGATDNANGILQLPSNTSSTTGIAWGADTVLYRFANDSLTMGVSGLLTLRYVGAPYSGGSYMDWGASISGSLVFYTYNGSTTSAALTLDDSQNSTFSGAIKAATGTSITTSGNFTLNIETSAAQAINFLPNGSTLFQMEPNGNFLIGTNASDLGTGKGLLQINTPAIATTSTPGSALVNATASTNSVTIQYPGSQVFIGHAWNTSGTPADNYIQGRWELRPISGTSPSWTYALSGSVSASSTPSYTDYMTIHPINGIVNNIGIFNNTSGASSGANGLYFSSSNTLELFTGGTLALTINSSQNLILNGGAITPTTNNTGGLGSGSAVWANAFVNVAQFFNHFDVTNGTTTPTGTWAGTTGKISLYNSIATAGWGVPAIQSAGRVTAQAAAQASIATYTLGAADGSFRISANINVTASATHSFSATCTYTDEGNTSRVLTLGFTQLSGATLVTLITNVTGVGPYESPAYHIRCKASTAITIATSGTFTSVTYNAEGSIHQIA